MGRDTGYFSSMLFALSLSLSLRLRPSIPPSPSHHTGRCLADFKLLNKLCVCCLLLTDHLKLQILPRCVLVSSFKKKKKFNFYFTSNVVSLSFSRRVWQDRKTDHSLQRLNCKFINVVRGVKATRFYHSLVCFQHFFLGGLLRCCRIKQCIPLLTCSDWSSVIFPMNSFQLLCL